ncbi:hypothetical protein C1H69_23015 [Billgrantia endophytica]|uniref:Uncharacterized protein n=2 Tax=Billgrantia endophytica TaxID=2033802 RepID=A0A2N7TUI4_9GAMM|nr:hypothetical protein C1H69_23015 [Halomonas endophytica]
MVYNVPAILAYLLMFIVSIGIIKLVLYVNKSEARELALKEEYEKKQASNDEKIKEQVNEKG